MRILLFGLSRSGTTGLWTKLCNSLPGHVGENEVFDDDSSPDLIRKNVGHTLLHYAPVRHDNFDKRIWLVRDPRDNLISHLMYVLAYHTPAPSREMKYILEQKCQNPGSVPVQEILRCLETYWGHTWLRYDESVRAHKRHGDAFYTYRYEDFVRGKLRGLERYLGFALSGSSDVDQSMARVSRTKWKDNWKRWFTKDDVRALKPKLNKFMRYFGYNTYDWDLDPNPRVTPEESYEYFARVRADSEFRDR